MYFLRSKTLLFIKNTRVIIGKTKVANKTISDVNSYKAQKRDVKHKDQLL